MSDPLTSHLQHAFLLCPRSTHSRHGNLRLWHRAVFLVLATVMILAPVAARAADEEEEEEGRSRYVYELHASVVESTPGGRAEAALAAYNKFKAKPGGITEANVGDLMREMYTAAGEGKEAFETVKMLIEGELDASSTSKEFNDAGHQYRQILEGDSKVMGNARDAKIEGAMLKVLERHKSDPDGAWEVARSDTGNPDSGMRSDLDQTFFMFRRDPKTGQRIRDPDLDATFIDEFKQVWDTDNRGLSLDMVDVVSVSGKARFPDPRNVSIADYSKAYHGTIAELRNIEGAYTTYGAVLQ